MTANKSKIATNRALDRADELLKATEALREAGVRGNSKEAARHALAVQRFKAALRPSALPERFRIHPLLRGLSVDERAVVFLLAVRRLRSGAEPAPGREILLNLERRASGLIKRSLLLAETGPLLSRGVVVSTRCDTALPLDREYALSDEALALLTRPERGRENPPSTLPYYDSVDHLMALRELVDLHAMRAGLLFPRSFWGEMDEDAPRSADVLTSLIAGKRAAIREREAASSGLSLVDLRREYGLREEEELVILALLFQELYTSTPAIEGHELVRLAAGTPADVIRLRQMFAPGGHLVECGLVLSEREREDKPSLCLCTLADWVASFLLRAPHSGIPDEERKRFQTYLKSLQNSEDFFRRL